LTNDTAVPAVGQIAASREAGTRYQASQTENLGIAERPETRS